MMDTFDAVAFSAGVDSTVFVRRWRDDLADAARVDRTPASLQVVEALGVDVEEFADELRQQYRVNVVDVCEEPPRDVG